MCEFTVNAHSKPLSDECTVELNQLELVTDRLIRSNSGMASFSESIKEFINVKGLAAKISALETELTLLKTLQVSIGGKRRGRKVGRPRGATAKASKAKSGKRGKVKGTVIAYLEKYKEAKASQIAKSSGLKLGSINQVLFALKKDGTVTQDKKRGSPFVLSKK